MNSQISLLPEELKLVEINAEIEYQKKINPLAFHENLPMQEKILSDDNKDILIFGGNRSSKTETAAKKVVTKGLKKCLRIWCVGETFSDSVNIQQRKIWNLIPKYRIKYGYWNEINGFPNRKMLLDNGSLIIFKSFDQGREAFQSDDIDLVWFDEEPPVDIYKECRMRLVDRNGDMMLSMTSLKGVTDLIADIYEDCDVIESRHAPLVKKQLPVLAEKNGYKIFFLWTSDNKYINQSRLEEEAKLMTEQEILSRIYGLPTNLSGKIYMQFNKQVHVTDIDDIPKTGNQLWNVLDPHDRKPWAVGWYLVNKNETVYCVDEYPNKDFNEMLYDDKTYADYAEIIKAKEASIRQLFGCTGKTKRVIDPNFGNKTVQMAERQGGQSKTTPRKELEKHGLAYEDGIDALEAGHLKVREILHWKAKEGQLIIAPKFYISSHCQNHITHLSRYSRKDIMAGDGDVKDKVQPQDKYKDFCDLTRYLWMANPRYIEQQVLITKARKTY